MRQNMTLVGLIGLKLLPCPVAQLPPINIKTETQIVRVLLSLPKPFFANYCIFSASTNQKTLYKKRTYNCQFIPPNYEGEARQPQRCRHVCVILLCAVQVVSEGVAPPVSRRSRDGQATMKPLTTLLCLGWSIPVFITSLNMTYSVVFVFINTS